MSKNIFALIVSYILSRIIFNFVTINVTNSFFKGLIEFLVFVVIFAFFYFITQQKKNKKTK